jgi:hypothetical protein
MNAMLLIFLLLSGVVRAACLPDTLSLNEKTIVDVHSAYEAIENFQTVMAPEMPQGNEIVIQLDALSPRVNAEINKIDNGVVIQIMGGMLKHQAMNADTLLVLLCHEIGHFLGGPPLKSRNGWSSTEGQSDYFSGLRCARSLGMDNQAFTQGALRLTAIYAEINREARPRLDRCDEKVVERTNYGYPSAQCRLDTLMAGWSGSARPRCWFND